MNNLTFIQAIPMQLMDLHRVSRTPGPHGSEIRTVTHKYGGRDTTVRQQNGSKEEGRINKSGKVSMVGRKSNFSGDGGNTSYDRRTRNTETHVDGDANL